MLGFGWVGGIWGKHPHVLGEGKAGKVTCTQATMPTCSKATVMPGTNRQEHEEQQCRTSACVAASASSRCSRARWADSSRDLALSSAAERSVKSA